MRERGEEGERLGAGVSVLCEGFWLVGSWERGSLEWESSIGNLLLTREPYLKLWRIVLT